MTVKKRLAAGLLAGVMAVSAVPVLGVSVGAESVDTELNAGDTFTEGNLIYEVHSYGAEKQLTIIGYEEKDGVTSLTIPAEVRGMAVTDIDGFDVVDGNYVSLFQNCKHLYDVVVMPGVPYIGGSFYGCKSLRTITLPASLGGGMVEAFAGCENLSEINVIDDVQEGNPNFVAVNDVLYEYNSYWKKLELTVYPAAKTDKTFTLPAQVHAILNQDLSENLYLEEIKVEEGNQTYFAVDGVLMRKEEAHNALVIYPSAKKDTSYTIPENITEIESAFQFCQNLTSVTIPKTVTKVLPTAFAVIDSQSTSVKDIYYEGTMLEWYQISSLLQPTELETFRYGDIVVHCSDGDMDEDHYEVSVNAAFASDGLSVKNAPVGTPVTQKTAVSDGKYNERFVQKVAASDVVNKTKATFTLSNGMVTKTVSTTHYNTSLTVDGETIPADEGCVFLVYTLTGIPEDVTVTVSGVVLE